MNDGAILMPRSVVENLSTERQRHLPDETGGFLIGLRRGKHIEVTDATYQGPTDRATRYSFERLDPGHERKAAAAWEGRDGLASIIGDWHSHPVGYAEPSGTDRHAWRVLAASVKAPVIGIIMADRGPPGVFLTGWTRPLLHLRQCVLIEETADELVFAPRASTVAGLRDWRFPPGLKKSLWRR